MSDRQSPHQPAAQLAGWDKPHRQYEPLEGQLELFGSHTQRLTTADGQQLLFDSGNDLPGIKDLVERGQQVLFDVAD